LKAVKNNGLQLLWVVLSSCDYHFFGLEKFQAVGDPKMPLDRLTPAEQNVALVNMCKKLKNALKKV
jgi:hypothetical protein